MLVALLGAVFALSGSAQPVCSINLGADVTICAGESTTITAPAGYPNYLWSTGATSQSITVSTAGTYWGEAIYTSANLVTNGDFSAGNTGFTSQWTYNSNLQGEGTYFVDNASTPHHPQFSGTGNGNFMIVNAGWGSVSQGFWDVWCQNITVCPGQTYALSYRARTLSNATPARLQWYVDGVPTGSEVTLPAFNNGWTTVNQLWTTGVGQTSANVCIRVMSGDGVGNDFGLDDISISGTIHLRDQVQVNVTPLPVVNLGPDQTLCQGDQYLLNAFVPGGSYVWQNNSTASSFNVTTAGNYSVTVTANGCSNSDNIAVAYNPNPVVDLGGDQSLCAGDQVVLDATTPGATYVWQNGSTAPTFNVSGPGTYDVDVTVNGCTTNDAVTVNYNPLPTVDLGPDQVLCEGTPLLLDATVTGGSYVWQDNSTSPTFNITTAGNYGVIVTANGCSNSGNITVAYNPNPVVDLGSDQTVCAGDQVLLDATTPGASYTWQDGSTAPTFDVSGPGTYDVDVTVNGCTTNDAVTLNYNPLPIVDLGPDLAICAGELITLDASQTGATYVWQDGSINGTFDVTNAGTYSVQVNLNGCIANDAINVTVDPMPVIDLGPDLMFCNGDQVLLDATTPGASYLWQDGSTAATLLATTTGTYDVDVTVNGCTTNDAITITFNPVPTVDLGPDNTVCQGTPLQLDASSPGATYLWQDGSTNATFDVTASGTYSVDVFLGTCEASDVINVTVQPAPVVDLGTDQAVCSGTAVTFDATVPGGSYLWQDNSTSATFTTDQPGTYSVTVTANGCSASDAVTLSTIGLGSVDLGPDEFLCQGETLTLDATLPGSSYLWSTLATSPSITISTAGTYWVTVSQNGCSISDSIEVTVGPVPLVDLGNDTTLCAQATLMLSAVVPGSTYHWTTGNVTSSIMINVAGTYGVTVNLGGCTAYDEVTVDYVPTLTLELGPDVTLCPEDELQLNASFPGGTTVWSTNTVGSSITVDDPGIYWATITVSSCSVSDSIIIDEVPLPSLDLGPDNTVCEGDAVAFDITVPGASYLWDDGSTGPVRSVSVAGIYWANVMLGGCLTTDTFDLSVSPIPMVDIGPDTTVCQGALLLLDATSSGAAYLWQDGSTGATFNVTGSGSYTVQVSVGTCTVEDAVNVIVNPVPIVDIGPDLSLCEGEETVLDATIPGATYVWQDGSTGPSYTVTAAGTVSVDVELNGCVGTDAATISYIPLPVVDLGPDTGICSGSVLQLNAMQPAGSYLWNDGNTSATVSASPGAWSVAVTVNGCTGTDGITIVALPSPLLELPDDTTLCDGATWLIDVDQSGASYQWMDGSSGPSYQVQQPGTYGVTVSLGACSATDDVVVDYIDASVITLGNDTTLCPGEQLVLVLDVAGIQLTWPDGGTDNTYTVSSAGTYTVQANAGGCLMSDVITVGYTPLPIPQLGDDRQLCEGDSLRLNVAAQNASVLWSDGSTNDSILVVGSATITVTLALDGCLASDQVNVVFMPVVDDLDLGPDATICLGDELVLDAGTPLATYSWNTGEGGPTITVTRPGIYHVVLTGPCINAADTVAITEGNCAPLVNVPNAFTPDGDGTNEVFAPVVSGTVRAWELRIFDRWGEELFNSNEPHKGWDGTFNGTPVQDGVYVWQLGYKAVSDDGVKQEKLTGSVTLLR